MVGKAVLSTLVLLILSGCTDLTEFDGTYHAGLLVLDPNSLSVTGSVTGLQGARCICPLSGSFLVATTEGLVMKLDLQSLEVLAEAMVDLASPAGFTEMVYSPMESTVYLIGSLGKLVEFRSSNLEVEEAFSICEAPVDLLMSGDDRPYMYVADAASERVLEVRLETNGISRTCLMRSSPVELAEDHRPDTMFAVTLESADLLSTPGIGIIRRRTLEDTHRFLTVADMPADTVLCGVVRFGETDAVVTVNRYFPPWGQGGGFSIWTGRVDLEGSVHLIEADAAGMYAYVLSYLGDGTSLLSEYDFRGYSVVRQVTVTGFPLDMKVMNTGEILILTT